MKTVLRGVTEAAAGKTGTAIIHNRESGKIYGLLALSGPGVVVAPSQGVLYVRERPEEVNRVIARGAYVTIDGVAEGWLPLKNRGVVQVNNFIGKVVTLAAPYPAASLTTIDYYKVKTYNETGELQHTLSLPFDEQGKVHVPLDNTVMPVEGSYLIRVTHPDFGKITLKAEMRRLVREANTRATLPETDSSALQKKIDDIQQGVGKAGEIYTAVGAFIDSAVKSGKPVSEREVREKLEELATRYGREVEGATSNNPPK